jgi:hypothetical protein
VQLSVHAPPPFFINHDFTATSLISAASSNSLQPLA